MYNSRRQKGQVLVTFAFCMIALIGFIGLAVDMGYLRLQKRKMQSAADSAAIAGATRINTGSSATITAAATADATLNGYVEPTNGTTVAIHWPPLSGGSHNGTAYVEAVISQPQPTFFMKIFGVNSAAMSARAVGFLGSSKGCIYALQTGPVNAITVNGNVFLNAPNCAITDNGNLLVNGNDTIHASSIGVAGTYTSNGVNDVTPSPTTSIVPVSDPLSNLTPPTVSGCSTFVVQANVNPGTYCNITINGNPTVHFNPGLYITNAGMTVNGNPTLTGSDVTFYNNSGAVTFNGNPSVTLSAQASGPDAGILFYQNPADNSAATINGNNTSTFTGALYFPGAQLTTNGGSSTGYTIIVAKTLVLNGNPQLGTDTSSLPSGSPIKDAVLVE